MNLIIFHKGHRFNPMGKKLFSNFPREFFVPLSGLSAIHSERVALKLYNNYLNDGMDCYRKDDLKKLVIEEKVGLDQSYTTEGLMEAMENGGWFEREYTYKMLRFEYIISDNLFNFCEAMSGITNKEEDIDTLVDIRDILGKIINSYSFDSIDTIKTMVAKDQRRVRKIRTHINSKIREIRYAKNNLDALRKCMDSEFINIYKKQISAAFSMRTDITPFISFIEDKLDPHNEEGQEIISNIAENAGDRKIPDEMTMEDYVYQQLNMLCDSLRLSKNFRVQVDERLAAITYEAIKRHRTLMSFQGFKTNIDYEAIFRNLDEIQGQEIDSPIIRTQVINNKELAKFPPVPKEKISADVVKRNSKRNSLMTLYDKAKEVNDKEAIAIAKKLGYSSLADVEINDINGLVLFTVLEKIARETDVINLNDTKGSIVDNEYLRFENRNF